MTGRPIDRDKATLCQHLKENDSKLNERNAQFLQKVIGGIRYELDCRGFMTTWFNISLLKRKSSTADTFEKWGGFAQDPGICGLDSNKVGETKQQKDRYFNREY